MTSLFLLLCFVSTAGAASLELSRPPVSSLARADALYFSRHQAAHLERSIQLLQEHLKGAPEDAQALWRLGRGLVRQGERLKNTKDRIRMFDRAQECLARSIALAPENAEAHYWSGLALGRKGETRGILRSLFMIGPLKNKMRKVLQLDPAHGGAHHVLGRMFYRLPGFAGGSKQEAVKELERALELAPDDSANYPALAQAYMAVKDWGKARQVLESFPALKDVSDPSVYAGHRDEVEALFSSLR